MNCLCCGKPLVDHETNGWHVSCAKKFFSTSSLPAISLDEKTLKALASESVNKGLTVGGVQKKISLHLSKEHGDSRLTLVDYPSGYILKPQTSDYPCLPEMEQLVMLMADATGIKTVPHGLLKDDFGFAYITKRVDRIEKKGTILKLAMEDFCQLDNRLVADKYKGSYERCAKIIERYSSRVGFDMGELFLRLVFSFVTGNSDMHLKNFSLIEDGYKTHSYVLSPAYDLLPTNIAVPSDPEEFALTMHGKKRNIRRSDFLYFASSCSLSEVATKNIIHQVLKLKETYIDMCRDSFLPDGLKDRFVELIEKRSSTLAE